MFLLLVYIGLILNACPTDDTTSGGHKAYYENPTRYALTLHSGDGLYDTAIQGCGRSYTGGVFAPGGNVRIVNNTITGFGTGIVVGDYYGNTSGSALLHNIIQLTGHKDANYTDRQQWGDGILIFDHSAIAYGNNISVSGYGRVGIAWDHAPPVISGDSMAQHNQVHGDFYSCYHIENQYVYLDNSNTHNKQCPRKCFVWPPDLNSSCMASYEPLPRPTLPSATSWASQLGVDSVLGLWLGSVAVLWAVWMGELLLSIVSDLLLFARVDC